MPKLVIKSEEERLVYAEVYSPLHIDTDGEAMTAIEIQKMAHGFLASGKTAKIDVQHNCEESGCVAVESFIARANDPDGFIEGSWVLGVKVLPDTLWEKVKSGELNGFSMYGMTSNRVARCRITQAKRMVGETEDSIGGPLPAHFHTVDLEFWEDGRIKSGETGDKLGHAHKVHKATATEKEFDHSHRMIIIENDGGTSG